ncbi:dentin sialophosphoprotein-like [Diaphorina citri]|uniref:Dentin sialophosphoprotein-like n=1 Tax=Diaphorina citri TaxID=121845 RepID=A0A1S4ET42_DIACI|nr:dentin sialophosphoprotein-like [Diaphorina citri]
MNHSCEPNCTAEKWTVSGDTRVGLFALRDVPAGTELVFNYELQKADNDGMRRCMCGAASCSGFIGAKKAVPPTSECEKGKEVTRARKALKARRRNRRGASSGGEKGEVPAVVEVCERCGEEGGEMLRCALSRCRLSYHVACASIPVLTSASTNPGLPSGTPVQTPTHTAPSENTGLPEGTKATLSSLSDLPGGTIGLPETIGLPNKSSGLPTESADASESSTTTLPTDSNPTRSTEIPTKANTNSTPKNDSSNKVDPSSKPKIDSNLRKVVYILTPSNTSKIETDKTKVNTNNTPKNDSSNSTPKNDSKNDNTHKPDSPGKLSPEKLEEYFEKHNIVDCNVSLDDVIANQTTIVVSPTDKLKNVTTIVVSPDGKVVVEKKKPGEMETTEGKVKKEGEDGQTVEKIDERLERMDEDVKVLQKESTKVDKESTRPVKDERQSAKLVKDSTKPVKESPTKSVEDDLPTTNKKKKSSISKELRKLMIDMVQPANLDVLSSALSGGVHSDQQRPKRKSLKATKDLVDSKAVEANKDVEDTKSSKHIKDIETDTNTINTKDSDLGNVVESGRKVVVSKLRNIESGAEKEVKDASEKEVLKGDNENESNPTSIGKRITRKSIKLDADSEGATEGVAPRKSLRRQQTSDDTILAGKEKIGNDSEDSLGKDFRERLRKLPEKTSVGKDSKDVKAIAVSMKKQSKEVEEMEEETDTKESLTSKSFDEPKDTSSRRRSCRQKPMGDAKDSLETADKNDNLRKTKDVSDQIQNVANECEDRLPTHEDVETKPNVNKPSKVTNKADKDRDAIEADSDEEVSLLARVKNGRKSLRSGIVESKEDASEQSGKRKSSRLGTKTDGNERTDSDTSKNDGSSGKIGTRNGEYEGGVRIATRKSEISGTTARITIPESGTNN